jgi:hypothetical protein
VLSDIEKNLSGGNFMNRIAKIMVAAFGFGLLTVSIALLTSRPAPAAHGSTPVPVKVTNTPLPIQGSVNANVTNTVPIAGTVAVSTLPPVALGSAITLPVQDVDNPDRHPVFGGCDFFNVPAGGLQTCNISFGSSTGRFSSVPAGNRLVIDFVSADLFLPSGSIPIDFTIPTSLIQGGSMGVSMDPRFVGTGVSPGPDLWKVSQQTRIYEDPGTTVVLTVQTTALAGSTISGIIGVTGHLVAIP